MPSGHLVKANSDLLGKQGRCPACKKTFELRYEDSLEFQRPQGKDRRARVIASGRAWVLGLLGVAFLVFIGMLVAVVVFLNR